MSAPKHTPWNTAGLRVSDANGRTVAIVERNDAIEDYQQQRAEAEALARLIAAAPEMLEALKYFATLGHPALGENFDTETVGRMLGAARTAIAKAEGRSE